MERLCGTSSKQADGCGLKESGCLSVETAGVEHTKTEANDVQVVSASILVLVSLSWTNARTCHLTTDGGAPGAWYEKRNTSSPLFVGSEWISLLFSWSCTHTPRLNRPG